MPDKQVWDITEALALADTWQNRFDGKNMPEGFFPQLHALAEYLHDNGQVQRAVDLLRSESSMGVSRFLGHRLEHARLLSRALFDAGESDEALKLVEYYGSRPYLFDDLNKLGYFLFCRSAHCLATHDALKLAHCVTLLVETQAGMKDANLIRIIQQAGGINALIRAAGSLDFSTRMLLRVFGLAQRLAGKGVAAGVIGRGLHFAVNILRSVSRLKGGNLVGLLPRRTPGKVRIRAMVGNNHPVVVTRAMGGIGDLLMMTPGLKALARKHPDREVWFAIPKGFHQLFYGFESIKTVDIDHLELYQEDCFALHNLTECPASRVETSTLPNVKQNRIDIFAAAMGITAKELDSVGRTPVYTVTDEERLWAISYLAQKNLEPGQAIAIQPYAADAYKNYPHMELLATKLARDTSVLVFHNSPLQGYENENILKVDNCTLRQSIALLSQCKMLVAVDSAFVHIAAALAIETASLFGPTNGELFTKYYDKCHVIHGHNVTNCHSCWRNKFVVCPRTHSNTSKCLYEIDIEYITEEIFNSYPEFVEEKATTIDESLKSILNFAKEKASSPKYSGGLGRVKFCISGIRWVFSRCFLTQKYGKFSLQIEIFFFNLLHFFEKPFKKHRHMDLLLVQPNGLGDAIINKAYSDYLIERMHFRKDRVLILATETWKGLEKELHPDSAVFFFNKQKFETNFLYRLSLYRYLKKYYFSYVLCNLRWKPRYITDRLMLVISGRNKAIAAHENSDHAQKVLFQQWCTKKKMNCVDVSDIRSEFRRIPQFYKHVFGKIIETPPRRTVFHRSACLASRYVRGNYIVLHVGNADVRRRWGVEKFSQVGEYFANKGYQILIVGGYCERDLIDAFDQKFKILIDQLHLAVSSSKCNTQSLGIGVF
ncbi:MULTISPECIES: glycosyltransferase family 9 protein [Desulfovibrio]|uniref:ADP-heptose:LPS heptosyltransferase n=1 Tax=Desulfovibrio desulfuricans TaxID=876 RepID=A0AA94HU83_DESDE|nr:MULTISPECIES: glycosyltransferase family 9 protein [Desulfovibrio]SFW63675.1 ADP-heptose:LPS heptosyltransferase [Desulfovibrio desulfuricans]SPD34844.1 Glycosyltransferase family 9 (heptosyltransferase) [Desulfovibrio sp. G11]